MKPLLLLCLLMLSGCSKSSNTPPVPYDPTSFRLDVALLIAKSDYRGAVALLRVADLDRQLAADGGGYLAIGSIDISLPGVNDPQLKYDRQRDWFVPGTSDAVEDAEWQQVATEFARRYNQRRQGLKK